MTDHTQGSRRHVAAACRYCGLALLAAWLLPTAYGTLSAHLTLARFQAEHAETTSWAPGRVQAYRHALAVAWPAPVAVLHLPAAHLDVPVLEGASTQVLNRGAGHLSGTAAPNSSTGNIVIAGHRDGFFRRLKNVAVGDTIQLARTDGVATYRVDALQVVERADTAALQPTRTPTLTLVTCYPFFYLGPAPQRYVVRASLVSLDPHTHS